MMESAAYKDGHHLHWSLHDCLQKIFDDLHLDLQKTEVLRLSIGHGHNLYLVKNLDFRSNLAEDKI